MNDILNKAVVLVLNCHWQAINTRTPAHVFCQMATDVATGLDVETNAAGETVGMTPVKWKDWVRLPIRTQDHAVKTVKGWVRIPSVVVLAHFAKVPKTRPKLTARAIRQRDGHRCQYTGRFLHGDEGNIDHVIPCSRGGKTTWENCVFASQEVNSWKADRLPE